MERTLLALFLGIFIISLASAATEELPPIDLGTFKQNQTANIFLDCTNSTSICSTSALCNITRLHYPNNSILLTNTVMTNPFHPNYNLTITDTIAIGKYSGVQLCCDNGLCGTRSFEYLVNPSGIDPSDQGDTYNRTIYVLFGVAALLFIAFIFVKPIPMKVTFFLFSMTFVLIGFNMVFIAIQDEVVNQGMVNFFDTFTAVSFYLYWFMGGLLFVTWFLTLLNTFFFKKNMREFERFGNG